MFRLSMEQTVLRLQQEVEGLRRQLDDLQSEGRGLRQAALQDAADDAGARRELQRQHRVALAAARTKAKADVAEELEMAVAAAKVEAREAERDRLRASVGPVLAGLQRQQTQLLEEAVVAKQRQEALEAELVVTRQLVFDALYDPAEVLVRLGL